jgi:2-polyprenyl-3-methyl-5-hydroxy-6-metoxy-1,4-benzoquinol methylase
LDNNKKVTYRGWEYSKRGDFHKQLNPNWSYTPTYLKKMAFVRREIDLLGKDAYMLDAGCGEGVLVEEFCSNGFHMQGLDLNYESPYVRRGSVLEMPYEDESFDAVLLLDVFEHLAFADQPVALVEIQRVLKKMGKLIISIPNMAHLNSRVRIALLGRIDRTDIETNHPGERPFVENRQFLKDAGFQIEKIKGVTLTVPFLYRRIICRRPARFRWLHNLLELLATPSMAMLDIFVCRKR